MSVKYNKPGGAEVGWGFVNGVTKNYPKEFATPKYVLFIKRALEANFKVILYMPKGSVSKYVTVIDGNARFKVRFSNHLPIEDFEAKKTCDFFVGVTNFTVTNTEHAWIEMMKHFRRDMDETYFWETNEQHE